MFESRVSNEIYHIIIFFCNYFIYLKNYSYKGFVLAPRTGDYRFYASADNSIAVFLSKLSNSSDSSQVE